MVMMKLTGIYSEGTFKNNEDRLGGWVYVTRFSVNKRNVVHCFVLASKHQHFLAEEEEEEQDHLTLLSPTKNLELEVRLLQEIRT